jgi:hypothetical protein
MLCRLQGPIFRTFFPGKILGKIPRKFFPLKMLGKIGIFRGKSFEKLFPQEIPRKIPRKITFCGNKCTKNWPQVEGDVSYVDAFLRLKSNRGQVCQMVYLSTNQKSQFW